MRFLIPVLFLLLSPVLRADVFSIFPFSGGAKQTASAETLGSLLDAKKFWTEPVQVNGVDMTMEIRFSDLSLLQAERLLKRQYPGLNIATGKNFMLAQLPLRGNMVRRIYLLELAGIHPLLVFSMDVPKKGYGDPLKLWPRQFPIYPGAEEITVLYFPVRKASFGSYLLPQVQKPQLLNDLASDMRASGWQTATRESDNVFAGSGNVFMKNDPLEMAIISVTESQDRSGVRAAFYSRPVK